LEAFKEYQSADITMNFLKTEEISKEINIDLQQKQLAQ
jgi:hypothetical protein